MAGASERSAPASDESPGQTDKGGPETEEAGSYSHPMAWHVRLSDNEPWKVRIVFAVAVAVLLIGTIPFRSLLLGVAGSAMILAMTAEFWLGTSYRLDEEGATSRTGLSVARVLWKDVKRAVVTSVGIKLSPLEESTRLAPFRGVFLRYGKEDRVRIEQAVRRLGGNDVRFVEGTAD